MEKIDEEDESDTIPAVLENCCISSADSSQSTIPAAVVLRKEDSEDEIMVSEIMKGENSFLDRVGGELKSLLVLKENLEKEIDEEKERQRRLISSADVDALEKMWMEKVREVSQKCAECLKDKIPNRTGLALQDCMDALEKKMGEVIEENRSSLAQMAEFSRGHDNQSN